MMVFRKTFGIYQTNCYIVREGEQELIIDPGEGSCEWVIKSVKNARAILLTHGHFDHIYDVAALKKELKVPIFIHKNDAFFLRSDQDYMGYECCEADFMVEEGEYVYGGFKFKYHYFPGHTPGCSMIEIDDMIFSGDFLFKDSIGRWDFEYSNGFDMLKSVEKCKQLKGRYTIYPGHGESTTLERERENFDAYIRYIKSTLK
ncbi:hypothetical protein LMG7974_01108 [Campylobacter majalis]|uniref:Metallo-beta-lactamase domain-containing protein n=1 Tax=Campylobacter majalis TaxID=2790656 RepID=A0ABM8Q778_9BACT|nr:MBL fold metallo-hydrolase [Campylobacter majalis]CAD7288647.1 hypothetical protein LMG7974_01108 [Campylobacter majalis]